MLFNFLKNAIVLNPTFFLGRARDHLNEGEDANLFPCRLATGVNGRC